MKWYTIAIPQWRKAKALGIELMDITVKSGDQRFAPFDDVLWAYKRGQVTDEDYTTIYQGKLQSLLRSDPSAIEALLDPEAGETESRAVACYCTAGKFCHRHIWIDFMRDVAEDNGIHFEYCGEIV